VPEGVVAVRTKQVQQFSAPLVAIGLEVQERPMPAHGVHGTDQDFRLHPFDVGLEQVETRQIERVDGDLRHVLPLRVRTQGEPADVVRDVRVQHRYHDAARRRSDGGLEGIRLRKRVEGQVPTERLVGEPLRLDRENRPGAADHLRKGDRKRAVIRTGFDDRHARPNQPTQELDLPFREFTIGEKRPSDVDVVPVHNHASVSRVNELVVRHRAGGVRFVRYCWVSQDCVLLFCGAGPSACRARRTRTG
jgi:hypothetical protein